MFIDRLLIVCALTVFASSAFAEEWEEVFTDKANSTNAKFYFDRNIVAVSGDAVRTQYKIMEPQPRPVSNSKPDGPHYDKAIYRTIIYCKNLHWKFLHRAYYLNDKIQFEENVPDNNTPAPPTGTAPYHLSEKACALKK